MSDAPQGPGWWQASDLKWYPPEDQQRSGRRSGPGWVLPAALLAVVALIAGIGAFVVLNDDTADASPVALEAANTTGTDPFTDSVTITEITEFPDTVQAVTNELTSQMTTDDTTGTLTTTGTTPGLYGGTRDNTACDPAKLATYLTDNPDKAGAWASAQNIDADDVADFIATLTPAYLTTDTLVTNHGFKNGKATPRPSVLQAGTAVLIDDTGTPRVRCSCGNPLTKPTTTGLADVATTGTPWADYTADTVTTITAGAALGTDDTPDTFTFTDINTGDTYQQPPATAGTTTPTAPPTTAAPKGPPVVLTETGVRITRPDGTVVEHSANGSNWEAVKADLTAALGTPTSATDGGNGPCDPWIYDWDSFRLFSYFAPGGSFYASVGASPGQTTNTSVASEKGLVAGAPAASIQALHPEARRVTPNEYNYSEGPDPYFIDVDGSGIGLVITTDDAIVTGISAAQYSPEEEAGDC